MSIFQDTAFEAVFQAATGRGLAKHLEERPDFCIPGAWAVSSSSSSSRPSATTTSSETEAQTRDDIQPSRSVVDKEAPVSVTTVTWYSDTDLENPQNWPSRKKTWVTILLFAYTFTAYAGSSIFTTSIPGITETYQVSQTVGSLGLSLYVFGYGISPLLFSPLSEIPVIGRNPPYAVSFSIFALLCIPMALVDNVPGILVLRFLLGFFSSPAVTTVGASYGDLFSADVMPYVILLWGSGASLAPTLAPLISSYAVQSLGWRWSSWELLMLSPPIAIFMFFTLPETSHDTLLLRRARRLRQLTGRDDLWSDSEIRQAAMTASDRARFALIKPLEINALDPAVLFTTIYLAFAYGIYYSFFESFPLVFRDLYGFSQGALGLAFASLFVGLIFAVVLLAAYMHFIGRPRMAKMASVPPEQRMIPGLVGSFLIPIGLFIFAWTARRSVPWIACMIGAAISLAGVNIVAQVVLVYLPFTYPRYAGSLFAANGLARSLFAGAAVLFSPPMFARLGVAGGVSLLAGLSGLCVLGLFAIFIYGPALRRRSRFVE